MDNMIKIFDSFGHGLAIHTEEAGMYRHDDAFCKPGLWRVIPNCSSYFYDFFNPKHRDAVIDDFGNLVAVNP